MASAKSRRAIVTGASGDLGRRLVQSLSIHGTQVIELPQGMDLTQGWQEIHRVLESHSPDVVYHAAAAKKTADSLNQLQLNAAMAHHVCAAIAEVPQGRRPLLINLSSAAELGVVDENFEYVDESYPCCPVTAYGRSKLCQTNTVLSLAKEWGFRAVCARVFNVVSLGGKTELLLESWARQVRGMNQKAGVPVLEVGDLNLVRDFVTSEQLMSMLVGLGEHPHAEGIVNLASGVGVLLKDAVSMLQECSGIPFEVHEQKLKFGSNPVRRVVASVTKLEGLLGTSIHFDLQKALQGLLNL